MGQDVVSPRVDATWWAPIAVVCAVAVPVGAILPVLLGQVGGVAFVISLVGLPVAVMGTIRDPRTGWKVAAIVAGLFHLAVLGFDLLLTMIMHGAFGSWPTA